MNNKPRRRTFTAGQFIAHPRAMVESPAMRARASPRGKALDRIEIEHMNHGGAQNGQLPVTYRDFEAWGIARHSVAAAIRELEALGFIEITRRGYGGSAELRTPSHYRLTYCPARNAGRNEGRHPRVPENQDRRASGSHRGGGSQECQSPKCRAQQKLFCHPPNRPIPAPKTWGENAFSRPPKRGYRLTPQNVGYFLESPGGGPDLSVVRPRPTASATS